MPFINDKAVNALFDWIESNANRLLVHETEPTTYTEATSGELGSVTVSGADYTRSDTTDGRKTQPAEFGYVAVATGTDNYVAQVDDNNNELIATHNIPTPAGVTEGLAYNLSDAFVEVQDPA